MVLYPIPQFAQCRESVWGTRWACQYSLCASTRSICMLYGTRGSGSSEKKLFMAPATVFTVKSFSAKSRLWSERKFKE